MDDMKDKLSETFNTNYEPTVNEKIVEVQQELKTLEERKTEIKSKIKNEITVEDREYIEYEIKSLIESNRNVMISLEQELTRPGTKASFFEVYSMVSNTVLNALRELRDLNKLIIDAAIAQRKLAVLENTRFLKETSGNQPQVTNNTLILDSKSLFKMIDDAKRNSSLNDVNADFKLEE